MLTVCYSVCHYIDCRYTVCLYIECHNDKGRNLACYLLGAKEQCALKMTNNCHNIKISFYFETLAVKTLINIKNCFFFKHYIKLDIYDRSLRQLNPA
jgi:hypothetical protein